MSPIPAPVLRTFYRTKAADQGWIDRHGRIQFAAVVHASKDFKLGRVSDPDLKFCEQPHWIFKLLHKHRTAMHPLKHLALLTLLGTETGELHGYWRSNGCDAGNSPVTRKCLTSGGEPAPSELTSRHERFLDQIKEVPARRARDYLWLYRHDYLWLKETISKLPRPQKPASKKVAWDERDRQFAAQVRHHAALLYQSNFRSRISATLLARATGQLALIEKFSIKLPLTTQTIQMLGETVEAFQCRRVRRTVSEKHAKGEVLARWRILRVAGLAPPLAPTVEAELTALLKLGPK